MLAGGALIALAIVHGNNLLHPLPKALTQEDIDGAVMHTLETKTLPSQAARAYEAIRGSVVRVREFERAEGEAEETESGVGTGVVIVDKGMILTNLHVVAGAERIARRLLRRHRSREATIIGAQPENDLAVLQAQDDSRRPDRRDACARPATWRPGDEVVAVGFPFGIGPSASARRRVGPEARVPLARRQAACSPT